MIRRFAGMESYVATVLGNQKNVLTGSLAHPSP